MTTESGAAVPGARRKAQLSMAVLTLTLPLYCITGLITPYLLGMVAIGVILAAIARGRIFALYRPAPALAFVAVYVVLIGTFALDASRPGDLKGAFNFVWLLFFAPVFGVLEPAAGPKASMRFARLAVVGAAGGVAAAIVGHLVFGDSRGSLPNLLPIRMATTSVLFGLLALIGLSADKSRFRWIYLLGPVFGLAAIGLTGSRGPLLQLVPLAIVAMVFFGRGGHWRRSILVLLLLAAIGTAAVLGLGPPHRFEELVGIAEHLWHGLAVTDVTSHIRLTLYRAGVQAFAASPWLGYGWVDKMSAVRPFLPPGEIGFANYPHLHNDFLNFAVSAGIPGILCYVSLLAIPIVFAVRSVRDSQYAFRVYGAVVLTVAYFCDGLTDLMFGFEYHTMLYVALTAILIGYCRDHPAVATAANRRAAG